MSDLPIAKDIRLLPTIAIFSNLAFIVYGDNSQERIVTDSPELEPIKDLPSPAREILNGIVLALLISALCITMAFGISSAETGNSPLVIAQSFYE